MTAGSTTVHPATNASPPPGPPASGAPAQLPNDVFWSQVREDATPLRKAVRLIEAHPWLMASTFAVMIAIKVLVVSKGDVATASLILGSGGFASLASVVILAIFPTAVAGAFVVIGAMAWGVAGAKGGSHWVLPAVVATIFALLAAVAVPWIVLVAVVGLMLVLGIPTFFINRSKKQRDEEQAAAAAAANQPPPQTTPATFGGGGRREFAAFLVLTLPIATFASAMSPTIWLPAERITMATPATETVTTTTTTTEATAKTSSTPEAETKTVVEETVSTAKVEPTAPTATGHVLSSDGDYTTILLEETRRTITVRTSTMTTRERCNLPLSGKSLIPALGIMPTYSVDCYP